MLVSHSNVTFQLLFPSGITTTRDPIEHIDEGVEFSLQFGSERGWIPITLTILSGITGRNASISIGTADTEGNILIRGYLPELIEADYGSTSVTICDFEDPVDSVQFRWLQTCAFITNAQVRDSWTLDSVRVSITYQDGKNGTFVLFNGSK